MHAATGLWSCPQLQLGSVLGGGRAPRQARISRHAGSNAYKNVVRHIGSAQFRDVLSKSGMLCGGGMRGGAVQLSVRVGERATVTLLPATNTAYIQERGFRTRKVEGIGMKGRGDFSDEWRGPFAELLGLSKSKKREGEEGRKAAAASDRDKWNAYELEMKRLPADQHRIFTEGYVKGLLTSKPAGVGGAEGGGAAGAKKTSPLTRFYVFLCVALFIFWMSGKVRFRLGDRSVGSLFFSSPQEVKPEDVQVTFDDVKGMDEAKNEVEEIVSYLRDPEKYSRLGGRLPKGVLMVGPPGTGKTLLARAIAGEAGVPFFHTSGSEFDEVLVGQGARRVRDLFEKAKARAPCIVFIDEIDSVGSKRVSNSIHPYANQTINQLLSEMDGFNRNEGIIVIAATNRVEDLDKALLRPGRFDVRVTVAKPDLSGRRDIFDLYLQRIVHSDRVDPHMLAKGTTGFTGADIENMVNQAALKAATENCVEVDMTHLDEAKDKVLMGPARTGGRIPDEEANKNTAYHEAGHTLVGLYTKDSVPLHKVTIIPRGQSLGHTALLPDKDSYQLTRSQMFAQLDMMMGGRVAEELIFGPDKVTTGASDDMRKATALATQMVKQFGFSEKLGIRDFTQAEEGGAMVKVSDLSPQTADAIDTEIARLLNESYARAKDILTKRKKEHVALSEALLEYETLSADEVRTVVGGKKLKRPTPAATKKSNEQRQNRPAFVHIHLLDDKPPVA